METLTSRQRELYRLLKSQPNHWFTQKEICDAIVGYVYKDDPFAHDHCATIGQDKRILNESPIVDKIIVMKDCCFKIATYEEYLQERASHIARLKSQVAQVEAMDRKFERNGQGKLFNNVLDDLKDNNEQFHETFVEKKEEPTEFPKEINGVKVYTRVLIDWKIRTAYIVTARKIRVEENTNSAISFLAKCELADGDTKYIDVSSLTTYTIEDFNNMGSFQDFKKEYVK